MKLAVIGVFLIAFSGAVGLMLKTARADDSFELMYYDPQLQDYVPGYSIKLMQNGGLIGYPRKLSTCSPATTDLPACATNMCRLNIQMQAWRACQEEHARKRRENVLNDASAGELASKAMPPPMQNSANSAATNATACFKLASDLLRRRISVLYSSASADEITDALALIDNEINALQSTPGHSYQVPCGMYISAGDTFPRVSVPKLVRLYIMMHTSAIDKRPRLIAAARLAYEFDLPTRNLSREVWRECFAQLEYLVFVRNTSVDDISGSPLDLCPAIADRPDLKLLADQDLGRTVQL